MIRVANINDAERLLEIYAYYVTNTAISFEYEVPTIDEFKNRIQNTLKKYPYLVMEVNGTIIGYTYAGPFKGRRAYDWAVETTIYLDQKYKRKGYGKKLYNALEKVLEKQNIINLYACIGYPVSEDEYLTMNSVQYHEHLGYQLVGRFHKCGNKFGRWYDMVWMEKNISKHIDQPVPIIKFSEIREYIDDNID